jgi:hypothetical protein
MFFCLSHFYYLLAAQKKRAVQNHCTAPFVDNDR